MVFSVSVADIMARVQERARQKRVVDEKLLAKYRLKVNKHLSRMETSSINIFFKYGNIELLQLLVDELEEAGFRARAHAFNDFGVHLYVDLPYGSQ